MLGRGDYSEKRGFNRMGVECPVTLRGADGALYQGKAMDLSATGLQVNMAQALELGAVLRLTMSPEQALVPPLEAMVEVVRVGGVEGAYEIGLGIKEMLPAPAAE